MTKPYLKGLKMKYIKFGTFSGKENMRIDSDILDNAILTQEKEPIFRLYAWSPKCISLGRNQLGGKVEGIDIVRRVTGGRALLHDDEVTYSYVTPVSAVPNGESVKESYKFISGILIDFFKTLGVELDFGGGVTRNKIDMDHDYCMLISTGADVCYNGKKIIGSAQCRKNGYILQHGSILFGYDKNLLQTLFNEEISENSITTVKEILPDMTKERFIKEFEKYITIKKEDNI